MVQPCGYLRIPLPLQLLSRLWRYSGASVPLLLIVLGSWANASLAQAEIHPNPRLLAQRVVDGLPPPPGGSYDLQSPPQPTPSFPSNSLNNNADSSINSANSTGQRYLVLVNGDSPLLLEQVRKVESGAFLQTLDGQRLIQAGSFNEANRAEQQVQALELQGIGAEIITAPAVVAAQPQLISAAPSPVIPSPDLTPAPASQGVVFGQAPSFNTPTPTSGGTLIAAANSYYVAIPGRTEDLEDIRNQVIRLGGSLGVAQSVIQRQSPLGPHVLVGPFINRRAAERWNHYLRSFGMDARVYYRR